MWSHKMYKKIIAIFLLMVPLYLTGEEATEGGDCNRLSETLGHLIARQLQQPGIEFSLDRVIQGMRDEQEGKGAPMSEEEYERAIYALQEKHFLELADKNLNLANTFLKENLSKEGVRELDPQLQFKILQEGNGEVVNTDSIPLIRYTGTLLDGTIFANTTTDQPVVLPIQQSIAGFAKGLVGMKEGEKRILYIHPGLAYGLSGQLPPNSLLIFEVEIVKANSSLGHPEVNENRPECS
jgi:peptidylprolyl isomerase